VADGTRPGTFACLGEVVNYIELQPSAVPAIFLVNKSDLGEPAAFDIRDANALAAGKGIPVLSTSAKTGQNVEEAFSRLGRMIVGAWQAASRQAKL
jgi:Fe2+ transport system protein B